jgi:hypothetical protein
VGFRFAIGTFIGSADPGVARSVAVGASRFRSSSSSARWRDFQRSHERVAACSIRLHVVTHGERDIRAAVNPKAPE